MSEWHESTRGLWMLRKAGRHGLWLPLLLLGCRQEPLRRVQPDAPQAATPDRLQVGERLAQSEVAFGLVVPEGLRITRQFRDAAYLSGPLPFEAALVHVREQLETTGAELRAQRAVFARALIVGDAEQRLMRIEVSPLPRGSQVLLRDITPPPVAIGLSDNERWARAGRRPDGTLLDPNQVY